MQTQETSWMPIGRHDASKRYTNEFVTHQKPVAPECVHTCIKTLKNHSKHHPGSPNQIEQKQQHQAPNRPKEIQK